MGGGGIRLRFVDALQQAAGNALAFAVQKDPESEVTKTRFRLSRKQQSNHVTDCLLIEASATDSINI